ncbi:MAG: NUDIX domain-containing protein [Gammaproteobacteria bacterium]|nr:NUDIX domain-containing protein [Gammaproteobacteria bacterium]
MNFPKVGIGVLIFNDEQKILLGKRKNAHGENTWGPPGGHLEWGESFQECAIRETYEETGLKISNLKVVGVTNDIFSESNMHYVSIFLKAHCHIGQSAQILEPDKVSVWRWFELSCLPNNLFLPLHNLIKNEYEEGKFSLSTAALSGADI